jgi:hypothetical protein
MHALPHRIRKQTWRVTSGSLQEGFAVRQRLRDALKDATFAFDAAFDDIASADEVVHVNRLELRIRVHAEELEAALPELLRAAIHEQLREVLGSFTDQTSPSAPVRRSTAESSVQDALITYLTTGVLPWSFADIERRSLLMRFTEAAARVEAVVPAVLQALGSEALPASCAFRLLQLLPENQWATAVRALGARVVETQALAEVVDALARAPFGRHRRLTLASLVLATGATQRAGPLPTEATRALEADLSSALDQPGSRSVEELLTRLPAEARPFLARRLAGLARPGERAVAPALSTTPSGRATPRPDSEELPRTPPQRDPAGATRSSAASTSALPVTHAGLVLVHPFLGRLFENVGVKEPGEPRLLPASLPRAAALLHWLATGEDEALECDFGMVKMLVGLEPTTQMPVASGLLSRSDRDEAEHALAAVVEHWSALGRTPVRALRESFLQRRGLLDGEARQWKLRVEPAAYDVLLSRLPWGIGMVKLPWMRNPIVTEWPTP